MTATIQGIRRTLLFCNGIETSEVTARGYANAISQVFNGEDVHLVHNPTRIWQYLSSSYMSSNETDGRLLGEAKIVAQLMDKILALLAGKDESHQLLLFAHSHGAEVSCKALEKIATQPHGKEVCQKLHVYTFGGAQIVPDCLAAKVQNYVCDGDLISHSGNMISPLRRQNGSQIVVLMSLYEAKRAASATSDSEVTVSLYDQQNRCCTVTVLKVTPPDQIQYEVMRGTSLMALVTVGLSNAWKWILSAGTQALGQHEFFTYSRQIASIKSSLAES